MSKMSRVLCGVPSHECTGSFVDTKQQVGSNLVHATREEAFNCMARYLVRQGYIRIGQREFAAPDNGPITVLTKKVRYGGRLRKGKSGEAAGAKGKRVMPESGQGLIF